MRRFSRFSIIFICIFLIAALVLVPKDSCYCGGERNSPWVALCSLVAAAVCFCTGQVIAGLVFVDAAIDTLNNPYGATGMGEGGGGGDHGSYDPDQGGKLTFIRAHLSSNYIPMDGNSSIGMSLEVITGDESIKNLPSGYKILLSHTNLYAMLYDDSGVGLASASGGVGGIDPSAGSVNITSVSPSVVPQGGVAMVNYATASQFENVAITVKDSSGNTVYNINESMPDKNNAIPFTWNTKDMSGSQVPKGTYSVSLKASGSAGTQYSNTSFVRVAENIGSADTVLQYINGVAKAKVTSPVPGSTTNTEDIFTAKMLNADGTILAKTSFSVHYVNELAEPDPNISSINAQPSQVKADGQEESIVTVVAKDSGGHLLSSRNVTFSSNRETQDIFSDTFVITNSEGIAQTCVKSNYAGQAVISGMIDNVLINSTAKINFVSLGNPQGIVAEAQRYKNCASYWYFRKSIKDETGSPPQNMGIIYSFGNKDSIELFNNKLSKSPSAKNWAEYLYKTGLDYDEYYGKDAEKKPWRYWAGIDCTGLIQRCANAAGYTKVDTLQDISNSEPYHVKGEINDFKPYSYLVTSSNNLDYDLIEAGDIIHFPTVSGPVQHFAIVCQKGYSLDEILVIHANGGGADAWQWKVISSKLSYFGRPFNVYRLSP